MKAPNKANAASTRIVSSFDQSFVLLLAAGFHSIFCFFFGILHSYKKLVTGVTRPLTAPITVSVTRYKVKQSPVPTLAKKYDVDT